LYPTIPSPGYIRQLIRERKVQKQSKDMLKNAPEKYAVKLHTPER
jgi:hypothetical protein